jgi:hypothetical protein
MRDFDAIWAGAGLSALMMVMAGCDSRERIHDPAAASRPTIGAVSVDDSSAYDRELIQAKTGHIDPALREQAIIRVFDKYGVTYPRSLAPVGPVMPEDADDAAPFRSAAAKASYIASSFNPLRRDFTGNTNDIVTFYYNITVQNGEGLAAAAIANTANVDPFLVAFYAEPGGTPIIQIVKVVAYNDDVSSGNRHSVINWTNNTGSAKGITVVAFAYSTATRGLAHLVVNTTNSSHSLINQPIGGLKQFGATPLPEEPTNCNFRGTQMTFKKVSGIADFTTALVIDTKAMRGGFLQRRDHTLELPWRVDNTYPSFALLYASVANPAGTVRLIQKDAYSCVN